MAIMVESAVITLAFLIKLLNRITEVMVALSPVLMLMRTRMPTPMAEGILLVPLIILLDPKPSATLTLMLTQMRTRVLTS